MNKKRKRKEVAHECIESDQPHNPWRVTISIHAVAILLTLVFITAKLWDKIDWSWWAVLSPLWILALVYLLLIILFLIIIIGVTILLFCVGWELME